MTFFCIAQESCCSKEKIRGIGECEKNNQVQDALQVHLDAPYFHFASSFELAFCSSCFKEEKACSQSHGLKISPVDFAR
jgi:hypothetical protein